MNGLGRVDRDGDPRLEGRQRLEASPVDDLVREKEVVDEPGGGHPDDLAGGGARERRMAVLPLASGERGRLVGLDVGTAAAAR